MQPLLFPLVICCSAVVRPAKAYTGRSSTWDLAEANANAIVEELQKQRALLDYMAALKNTSYGHVIRPGTLPLQGDGVGPPAKAIHPPRSTQLSGCFCEWH